MFKFLVAHKEGKEAEIVVAMFALREDAEVFVDSMRNKFPDCNWYVK